MCWTNLTSPWIDGKQKTVGRRAVLNVFPDGRPVLIAFAQLAQNCGWYTSQVASKGLTRALKPLFPALHCKPLKLKKAEAIPGSATNLHFAAQLSSQTKVLDAVGRPVVERHRGKCTYCGAVFVINYVGPLWGVG
jgi:hypothetical protein